MGSSRNAAALVLIACSLALCIRQSIAATSYNVSSIFYSPYPASFTSHPPPVGCTLPGICVPTPPMVLTPYTMFLWCGFSSTHKTYYEVTSTTFNLTVLLVRWHDFQVYALHNLSNMANVPVIANSLCDMSKGSLTKCDNRTFGLVFYDEICLVATNSKSKNATFIVQIINTYDQARYGGVVTLICLTIFTIIFCIIYWTLNIYREIKRPIVDKSHPISSSNEVARFDGAGIPPAPEPFTLKFKRQMTRLFSSKAPDAKAEALPQ